MVFFFAPGPKNIQEKANKQIFFLFRGFQRPSSEATPFFIPLPSPSKKGALRQAGTECKGGGLGKGGSFVIFAAKQKYKKKANSFFFLFFFSALGGGAKNILAKYIFAAKPKFRLAAPSLPNPPFPPLQCVAMHRGDAS